MAWTGTNVLLVVIGVAAVAGSIALIRYRVAVNRFVVAQNTRMYGKWVGDRMGRVGPILGVVVPAVFGIILGAVFVLVGIFAPTR